MAHQPSKHPRRNIARIAAITAVILGAALLVGLGAFYKIAAPKIAQEAITGRLDRLEARTGLTIKTGSIEPDGLQGVVLTDVTLHEPDGVTTLVHIKRMRVAVDRAALLAGDKVIRGAALEGVQINVRRAADGQLAVAPALARLRAKNDGEDKATGEEGKEGGALSRYFGDALPELEISELVVRFTSEDPARPMPLKSISVASLTVDSSGDSAEVAGALTIERAAQSPWELPTRVDISGKLALPLEQSALKIAMDSPARISGLPPAPYIEIGFAGINVEPGGAISVAGLRVGAAGAAPLFEATSLSAKLARYSPRPRAADLRELLVESPVVRLSYAVDGSSELDPWIDLIRPQSAAHISAHATKMAADIHAARTGVKAAPVDDEEGEPPAAPAPSGAERPSARQRMQRLLARVTSGAIPDKIEIRGARIIIDDKRRLPLAGGGARIQLRDGRFAVAHDAAQGVLSAEWAFEALGDKEERQRGGMSGDVTVNYKEFGVKAQLRSQGLDLAWVAQMGGPRLADHLRAGLLRMNIAVSQAGTGQPIHFEGEVGVDRGAVSWERIAEGVIDGWSASYAFEGTLDPRAPIPAPKLLVVVDPNAPPDPKSTNRKRISIEPPTEGALVFTRGEARLGGAQATVLPALYGLDLDKPLPTRLDLQVKLPKTQVQTLFDAVPDALKGDLVGTQLAGSFAWELQLEVPVYDASETAWRANTDLSESFEIVSMPSAVDVRKLGDSFVHTIVDERVNFERRVRIPEMTLTPGDWMMANVGLTPDELDRHWREGGWFTPPPTRGSDGVMRERSPEYWTSPLALSQRPGKPWSDGYDESILRSWRPPRERNKKPILKADGNPDMELMSRNPYGPYVYVPLPFISQYVVRAILTTEDHVFFKHDGFNRSALKESVERNLAAQEYVRGASTISMQLVKNLYLSRKKVMSRKLQEAFLVFLIESYLHVPKARLLEIYLNIIEFGPGVFGIHDAALHYFGKRPDMLTLPEAAWIVTLVPSPKRWHQLWEKNTVMPDKGWDRVRRYMQAMVSRGKIAQAEVDAGLLARPEFHHPAPDTPAMRPVPAAGPVVPIFGEPDGTGPARPSPERFEEEMRELLE
jgi:hypothetical protein